MLPNYFLEILKWKILGSRLEKRTFSQSLTEVLRGLRLGILTPLMIGDYWGRSQDFKNENKGNAIFLNLYNSLTQTWTALVFGTLALIFFYQDTQNFNLLFPIFLLGLSSILGILFLYNLEPNFFHKIKFLAKYLSHFALDLKTRNQIILLSVARTLIYNFQYILFYKAFGVILSSKIFFSGVNIMLLVKTVGGGLNIFGDLSLRELISLNFFGLYEVDLRLVLISTFVVWLVNVFVPILFGLFYKTHK